MNDLKEEETSLGLQAIIGIPVEEKIVKQKKPNKFRAPLEVLLTSSILFTWGRYYYMQVLTPEK